jgi:hypothetical protein
MEAPTPAQQKIVISIEYFKRQINTAEQIYSRELNKLEAKREEAFRKAEAVRQESIRKAEASFEIKSKASENRKNTNIKYYENSIDRLYLKLNPASQN